MPDEFSCTCAVVQAVDTDLATGFSTRATVGVTYFPEYKSHLSTLAFKGREGGRTYCSNLKTGVQLIIGCDL